MEAYHLLLLLCFVMVYPNLLLQRLSELRICCVECAGGREKAFIFISLASSLTPSHLSSQERIGTNLI